MRSPKADTRHSYNPAFFALFAFIFLFLKTTDSFSEPGNALLNQEITEAYSEEGLSAIGEQKTSRIEDFYGIPYDLSEMEETYEPSNLIMAISDILLNLGIEISGVKVLENGLVRGLAKIAKTSNVNRYGDVVESKNILLLTSDVALEPQRIIPILKEEKPPTEAQIRQEEVDEARKETLDSMFGGKYLSEEENKKMSAQLAKKGADMLEGFKNTLEKGFNFKVNGVKVKVHDYYQSFGDCFNREDTFIAKQGSLLPTGENIKTGQELEQARAVEEKAFYPDGKLEIAAFYFKGKKNGPYAEFYPDGKKRVEAEFIDDVRVGAYKEYAVDGNLSYQESYKEGKLHGEALEFYPGGQLKSKDYYEDGLLSEKSNSYYLSGKLQFVANYKNGQLNGLLQEFYEEGQLKTAINYKDGMLSGHYASYYAGGRIKSEADYQDGKRNGKVKEYYETGTVKTEASYQDGSRVGSYFEYGEQGNLIYQEEYKDGELDGYSREFYPNGKVKFENMFVKGKLNGESKYYYENGNIKNLINYVDGKLSGVSRDYDEEGKLLKELFYENDQPAADKNDSEKNN
ncbi:MAG: toxin-antitoxin system YwqK family antitoxin [Candidatus Omnitrophica bacterium]|nr:toxin-antitoxin system YwqK family antitoxin [Candidatus Omnitrophota bacterium]